MADFFDALTGTHANRQLKIPVHAVMAGVRDIHLGGSTAAQLKTWIGAEFAATGETLSPAGEAEIDALVNDVGNVGSAANQDRRAEEWESVLILGEAGIKYTSVADVKTRMGL